MTPEREELAAAIFAEAAELSGAARAALLDQRCGADVELRSDVEALLHADERGVSSGFLSPPGVVRSPHANDEQVFALAPGAGHRVGRYRIVRIIASGGMGTVYEAEQDQPRRTVALKIIRPGTVSAVMLRRFEYEAQVLGSLQHAGIAQVYEAGTHASGEPGAPGIPFIAMELVAGARQIVEYAAGASLPLRERVALMARVCDAVQHAHQRGVMHRDLKPGNILIDASGQPKIIDFGVAGVVGVGAAHTLHTSPGQLLGTLRYMSPEQCEGDPGAIDTRTDVYSLGVVLYELITGAHPYDLSSASIAGACRVIREVAPTRPSVFEDAARGDVETIILKALEKEPERRYQSAGDLAADLRRWLAHEPIAAHPPSAAYQLRKFARRNRALVTVAGIALLALIAGAVGTSWQAVRAVRQRNLADSARLAADQAREAALAEAEVSRRVTEFFENLLASADPAQAQGRKITVQELVERASANLGDSLDDHPLVEAGVRSALGRTFSGLGDYAKAEEHLRAAVRIRAAHLGRDAPATLDARQNLFSVYWMQGRLDDALAEAEIIVEDARSTFGDTSEAYFKAVDSLATVLGARGEFERAIELNRGALDGFTALHGRGHPRTIITLNNLAFKFDSIGRSADAEPLFREALAAHRALHGEDHPDTASSLVNLANCLRTQRKLDEAESLARAALETRRRIYPAGHPLTGDAAHLIGRILYNRDDWSGAVPYLAEALDTHRASLPEGSWRTAVSSAWLGMAYTKCRRYDEAERLLLDAHTTLQRTKGQHPTQEAGTITALEELYKAWDKPEKAAEFGAMLKP